MKNITKILGFIGLLLCPYLLMGATTNAIYLHHERSTLANLEADLQNRELGLNPTDRTAVVRFSSGLYGHLVSQEQPAVALTGTLGVTGATSLLNTLSVSGASTLAAMSATTGNFSSTLSASGQSTLAGITLNGGSSGQGRLYTTSTVGLALQSLAGSSYDFSILGTSGIGSYVMRVPTGTTTAVFPNAMEMSFLSSGRIPYAGSGGAIGQDNLYWDATNDRLGIGATSPARTLHVTASSGDVAQRINASTGYTAYNEYTENNSTTAGNYWQIGKEATTNRLFFFNGSTRLEITSAGAVTIPGTLGVTGAASTGALTATTITLGGGESFVYGDTSFTLTGSTGWTTTPTGTSQARRIGNIVTLTVPYLSGTSNSTSTTITGIPSGWYPSTYVQYVPLSITVDNGTTGYGGTARILTSGGITVYPNNGTAWTASGSKEVGEGSGHQTITYVLQ